MKLSIYHGTNKPMIAIGKHQVATLSFAEKYHGWHSFAQDRNTKRAVYRLAEKGYLEISNVSNQFRITYPTI